MTIILTYVSLIQGISAQVARARAREVWWKKEEDEAMKHMYRESKHNYRIQPCSAYFLSFPEESHHFRAAFGEVQGRLAILWVCVYTYGSNKHTHTKHTQRIRDDNIISEVKKRRKKKKMRQTTGMHIWQRLRVHILLPARCTRAHRAKT
jgi:hypothetical protein